MCSNLKLSAYKIIRKNYSNLFFAAVLFLTGCSMTFPLPDEKNQTMLIIPVETRQTLRHFVFTLDISIENSANNKNIRCLKFVSVKSGLSLFSISFNT